MLTTLCVVSDCAPPPPPPPNQKLFPTPLAQGGCNCRSFYDGQEDLLFYLENKHLLTYGLLFQYLHLMIMIEGKNPLAAFHRSVGQCHRVLGTTQPPTLKILRSSWNALYLLGCSTSSLLGTSSAQFVDVHLKQLFVMALWWNLERIFSQLSFKNPTENLSRYLVEASTDHVFLRSVKGQELLMKYNGYSKDRKTLPSPKPQVNCSLCFVLWREGLQSTCDLISSLQEETNPNIAPHPYHAQNYPATLWYLSVPQK